MKYLTVEDQLKKERRKNEALQAKLLKAQADLDYVAMMTDIELETEEEPQEVAEDE